MDNKALFVDFMYAVTVGTALPRVDEKTLHLCNPLLWALAFLITVFLEDFYLYHVKVVPNLKSFPRWRGFLLAMLIIATWYLAQAAFPTNQLLFLMSFATFFLLKMLGGVFMKDTSYPSAQDAVFFLPVMAAILLAVLAKCLSLPSHPGRSIELLAPVWLLTVLLWWSMDDSEVAPVSEPRSSQPEP
jgi:hypothetical protein